MKAEILERLLDLRATDRPAVLVTDLASGSQLLLPEGEPPVGDLADRPDLRAWAAEARRSDRATVRDADGARLFIQPFNPRLRLLVVGAVHIAQALAPMSALAGYAVTVIDPRRAFASDDRFPSVAIARDWPDEAMERLAPDHRTAVVTLTHDPKLDDPALDVALRSEAFYIAALGSRKTHAARLQRLAALGHGPAALARIHGPAGLEIGALSPAEIAVSVLAELTASLRGAPARAAAA